MPRKRRFLVSVVFALMLAMFVTTSAFAHFCTNVNKNPGAGSIGLYDGTTDTFTMYTNGNSSNSNGGFVTVTLDGVNYYDIFIHQFLPSGALAAGPDGASQCDGHGVDFALACLGISMP